VCVCVCVLVWGGRGWELPSLKLEWLVVGFQVYMPIPFSN